MAIEKMTVTLGTATAGGGFPVFGEALASAVREADPGLEVICRSTRGSAENIPLLASGVLHLALVQGEAAHEAFSCAGAHSDTLKIVSAMYPQAGVFCVRAASPYRRIQDLAGQRVVFGVRTSGLVLLARYVLDGLGLDQQRDFAAMYPDEAGEGVRLLREGRAEALWGAGEGWPGFIAAMRSPGGRFIAPDDAERARIVARHSFLRPIAIPALTYEGQFEEIASVGSWSMVLAGPMLDAQSAYRLAGALHRAEPLLASRLPAAREATAANTVALPRARERLHPGVARYLSEQGLLTTAC